jgi:hypothetical protein
VQDDKKSANDYLTVRGQPEGRFLRLKIKDKNGRFKKGVMRLKRSANQPRGRFLRLKIEDKNGRFKKGVKKCQG